MVIDINNKSNEEKIVNMVWDRRWIYDVWILQGI
jgi:hypothetical protein